MNDVGRVIHHYKGGVATIEEDWPLHYEAQSVVSGRFRLEKTTLAMNGWSFIPASKQVGGTHYEDLAISPWEIIEKNGLDFWQGNVIKYVLRKKKPLEDLKKARHYIDYLIEREEKKNV
jgi:hypothetical protein